MDEIPFGQTDLRVTPMGLGLAALGRPGYINLGHAQDLPKTYQITAMQAHAHDVLDAAWRAGVRYFDVARSYGRAEEFLSSWLTQRDLRKRDTTVGSKWGYAYTAAWRAQLPPGEKHEVKDHSLNVLNRQFEESERRLNGHLNIYHVHSATPESRIFENAEVLARLAELRDRGLIIGFSTSGPHQADTIRTGMAIECGGRPLFQSVQATWNLLEQSAAKALEEAQRAGRGIIVKEAVANGRLTARNKDATFRHQHSQLYRMAEALQVSIDAIAIALVLRQRWVHVVLSGAATPGQLDSNLKALNLLEHTELDSLLEMSDPPEDYWSVRGQLTWN